MIIKFREDVVLCANVFVDLDRIIHRIEEGAHEWYVEDPEKFEESDWLKSRPWFQDLFEKAATISTYPANGFPVKSVTVAITPAIGELTPPMAARYAATPLTILMENRFTDGLLLDIAIEFLATTPLLKLISKRINNVIDYDSPGGNGELPKTVAAYAAEAARTGIPPRVIVFTDSDSRFPGDLNTGADNVSKSCLANGICCHMLSKRNIENYIPDEVFISWSQVDPMNPGPKEKVAALQRLSIEQRDHIAIKNGLKADGKLVPEEIALYGNISVSDRTLLEKGFPGAIEWLAEFKKVLSAEVLRKRDHRNDLESIVRTISAEI